MARWKPRKAPASPTDPPPAPAVAVALESCCVSPADVTDAFTVAGPFAVPATVAELVTSARLIATAAPIVSGGARATVADPSAFAFASLFADDQTVNPPELTVMPVGSVALVDVFARFTETAAAAETVPPPDVLGDGAAGSDPVVGAPLWVAALFANVR